MESRDREVGGGGGVGKNWGGRGSDQGREL